MHKLIAISSLMTPLHPLPAADLAHILHHTTSLWSELNGARFFITGGTGFFGIWLLETLAHAKQHLGLDLKATVLTRNKNAFAQKAPHLAQNPMFDWQEGDVRNFPFPKGDFSHIIHAGSTANPNQLREMLDIIIDGTRRVLDFAAQSRCQRLLFISSGAVYGSQPPELDRIPEDFPCAPNPMHPASAYGEGKRVAELLCALAARETGIACVIARCFAFIGPHLPLDIHYAAGNFLRDALKGRPIHIESDGRPVRAWLYMADLMVWLLTLLLKGQSCRPYNVGSDQAVSLAELAAIVRDTFFPRGAIECRGPLTQHPVPRYVPDIHRVCKEFGVDVRIMLPDAILRTAAWLRKPDKR